MEDKQGEQQLCVCVSLCVCVCVCESWAECGNLALKELQTEICFCLTRMGHFKVSIVP